MPVLGIRIRKQISAIGILGIDELAERKDVKKICDQQLSKIPRIKSFYRLVVSELSHDIYLYCIRHILRLVVFR